LKCASTTGVYPGMPVAAPNFPVGCFVAAVKSTTELELWLSVFNLSTGVASTTAANANATATATVDASGNTLLARALGYHPSCIIASAFFMGAWRNQFTTSERAVGSGPGITKGPGVADIVEPVIGSPNTSGWTLYPNTVRQVVTDALAATPLKRHNGELWGVRPVVHTSGHLSHVPAHPKSGLIYTGA